MGNQSAVRAYSIDGACEALSVSRTKLYDLMKRGLLRYVEIDSVRRIPASEIERIVAEGIGGKAA